MTNDTQNNAKVYELVSHLTGGEALVIFFCGLDQHFKRKLANHILKREA